MQGKLKVHFFPAGVVAGPCLWTSLVSMGVLLLGLLQVSIAVGISTGEYWSKAKFSRSQMLVLTSSQLQVLTSTKVLNQQSPIR